MIIENEKVLVVIVVDKQLSQKLIETLYSIGIYNVYITPGRTSVIEEKEGLFSFLSGKKIVNDPAEIITFFISKDDEPLVLNYLCRKLDFKTPGRGTIYSKNIRWVKSHPLCNESQQLNISSEPESVMYKELMVICCIAQRGEGEHIAKICLETGASVPVINYGIGTGVRDKLGLLRITIPGEKEIVSMLMSAYDSDSVMDLIIDEGKLDQPGKGFIYTYPVKHGVVNTKISRGKTGQVASMEQVVSAIDALNNGMEWRKSRLENEASRSRFYLTNILELTLICNEGHSTHLIKAAMEAGAAGATISKLSYRSRQDESDKIPTTREICRMVVGESQISDITDAVEKAGGFGDEAHGLLYCFPANKAFTYIAKK